MKFLFAPDSFKGSLTSIEISSCLEKYAKKYFPEAETLSLPIADGGEGIIDALLLPIGGRREAITVKGPTGEMTKAEIGYIHEGKTAVLEMAQASGLNLTGNRKDPFEATSYGTGQMIQHVVNKGVRSIAIGIGGSATNDGGMGALTALGVTFFDSEGRRLTGCGKNLEKVVRIELDNLYERFRSIKISVICDVVNPLLGPKGATYIYGPQKGVRPEELEDLDKGMGSYIGVVEKTLGKELRNLPGAGAAGGMGAALSGFLNAELKPGIDVVLDLAGFDRLIKNVSLVVTGEGRIDRQSVEFGKVVGGILRRCRMQNVPVAIIAGSMDPSANLTYKEQMISIITTVNDVMTTGQAMGNASELLESAAERMFSLLKIGQTLK